MQEFQIFVHRLDAQVDGLGLEELHQITFVGHQVFLAYGYLPKRLKKLVDEIVDEMERLPGVSRCYDQWLMLQGKVDSYYHDKPQKRIPFSRQKEFRQIKNAVIQEAERLPSVETSRTMLPASHAQSGLWEKWMSGFSALTM